MIFTQVQNFAARWQQRRVSIVASIVKNHINSLEQLINYNILYILICLHVGNVKPQNYVLHRNHNKSIKPKSWHISYIVFCGTGNKLGPFTHHQMWRKNIQHLYEVVVLRFLMNVISKYLFLEQFCQFSEGIPWFLSEAGDSIHSFSSCTHIGALKTACKCKIS